MSLADVLDGRMPWAETLALFRVLVNDPTSHIAAAIRGYLHPWSREAFVLADLYDLTVAAHSNGKGRSKPYPRPTDEPPKRIGDASLLTQAEILAALAERGHGPGARRPRRRDARGRFAPAS